MKSQAVRDRFTIDSMRDPVTRNARRTHAGTD
ncbi:hypothetical protein CBA19C6_00875 [Cupriavidus pauculus]|nr:hypothetical protein CBA19C6_00875 [Cupriavidus pauculus]